MEVVAVQPKVEDVEGAHGRPTVLVAEGERRQAVRLHLRAEGEEIGPGRRDGVTLGREDALPVEDAPRVVVDRDAIDMLVVADDRVREAGRVVGRNLGPKIVDRGGKTLVREEAHPVAGEPEEDVVRGGAQVVVDLILERVVVDGVHRRVKARGGLERGVDGLDAGEVRGVRVVVAERELSGQLAGHGSWGSSRRSGTRTAGGNDRRKHGQTGGANESLLEDFTPTYLPSTKKAGFLRINHVVPSPPCAAD